MISSIYTFTNPRYDDSPRLCLLRGRGGLDNRLEREGEKNYPKHRVATLKSGKRRKLVNIENFIFFFPAPQRRKKWLIWSETEYIETWKIRKERKKKKIENFVIFLGWWTWDPGGNETMYIDTRKEKKTEKYPQLHNFPDVKFTCRDELDNQVRKGRKRI